MLPPPGLHCACELSMPMFWGSTSSLFQMDRIGSGPCELICFYPYPVSQKQAMPLLRPRLSHRPSLPARTAAGMHTLLDDLSCSLLSVASLLHARAAADRRLLGIVQRACTALTEAASESVAAAVAAELRGQQVHELIGSVVQMIRGLAGSKG